MVELIVPVEDPPDLEKTTLSPPLVSELPAASLVVKVRVDIAPEEIVEEETFKVD